MIIFGAKHARQFSFRATASVKSIPLSPLKINDLEGIQPMLIHVPPYIRVDFSTTKTDSPFEANAFAKVLPPFPNRSQYFDIFPSFSLASFYLPIGTKYDNR